MLLVPIVPVPLVLVPIDPVPVVLVPVVVWSVPVVEVAVPCELVGCCWSVGFVPVVLVDPCVPIVEGLVVPVELVPMSLVPVDVLVPTCPDVVPVVPVPVVPVCAIATPVANSATDAK